MAPREDAGAKFQYRTMESRAPNGFPRPSRLMRVVAWVALAAFAAACTKQVVRGPLETRHYAVDWENLPSQRIISGGLVVDAVVLTPSQWPLEASVKQLFSGEFEGVVENFDLSFHSSTLRDDMLERLFEEGFLPAYLRVRNMGDGEARFEPTRYVVRADRDIVYFPFPAQDLPGRFKEIDWARTGLTVLLAALVVVVLVASAKEGSSRRMPNFNVPSVRLYGRAPLGGGEAPGGGPAPSDKGLLRAALLAPGEVLEGFLFFQMHDSVADWSTARLALLRK